MAKEYQLILTPVTLDLYNREHELIQQPIFSWSHKLVIDFMHKVGHSYDEQQLSSIILNTKEFLKIQKENEEFKNTIAKLRGNIERFESQFKKISSSDTEQHIKHMKIMNYISNISLWKLILPWYNLEITNKIMNILNDEDED
ncbi:MAG: hypothetical protein AABY22_29740 [Nanoarchaeota archaeon]